MMQQDKRLPIFVYGTLRRGEGNYDWALAGKTSKEYEASLTGASMYGRTGFPYIVLNDDNEPESTIVGMVAEVIPELYDEVLSSLDALEGYSGVSSKFNHYDRVIRNVVAKDGTVTEVYVYVASSASGYDKQVRESQPLIACGDWLLHLEQMQSLSVAGVQVDNWWETYR